jgi:battenin
MKLEEHSYSEADKETWESHEFIQTGESSYMNASATKVSGPPMNGGNGKAEEVDRSLLDPHHLTQWTVWGGFFGLGLVNNAGYVIMIAGAKDLDSSMVGLIFLCSVFPSGCVKATGPYWYHLLSYRRRVILCSMMMALSFVVVGIGRTHEITALELLGVSLGSAQSGMGEASFLALSSFFTPSSTALNGWSSGTGAAGIFGYAWVVFFSMGLQLDFSMTLYIATCCLPIAFHIIFAFVLRSPRPEENRALSSSVRSNSKAWGDDDQAMMGISQSPMLMTPGEGEGEGEGEGYGSDDIPRNNRNSNSSDTKEVEEARMTETTSSLTSAQRFQLTLRLWPYMVPLALVYFAEYAMQSGTWAAMGFPVGSEAARKEFYQFSNWTYQAGVLIARSSGALWTPTRGKLWFMPALQCVFLAFSVANAYYMWWYDWSILLLCFLVGLQGGLCYIGVYSLIAIEVAPELKEFSLAAASLADSLGIVLADVSGILIQKALYSYHGITDSG